MIRKVLWDLRIKNHIHKIDCDVVYIDVVYIDLHGFTGRLIRGLNTSIVYIYWTQLPHSG